MVEKLTILSSKVRHVGTFDMKETYRVLFEWLVEKGYEVNENKYIEIAQAAGAKEVDIFWDAKKSVSDYFQFAIDIRFHPLAMTSVEVDVDGVKQKMNKGDFTIEYKCHLVKDYKNGWKKTSLLRNFYDKYLVRDRIEQMKGKLISEYEELLEYTKSFLILTGKRFS